MSEGMIAVPGGNVWYERLGDGDKTPLLILHGGPGAGHNYVRPIAVAQSDVRPCIVYDQLGCGKSDCPDDLSLWTIDRFVEELAAVRDALGLDTVHLLGQSWGGWLAIDYMARGKSGVASLTLASTSASAHEFVTAAGKLIEGLPEPHRTALMQGNSTGDYDDPAYLAGVEVFYKQHVCRMDPWPQELNETSEILEGNIVYLTMNGPNEFAVIGTFKTWDRTADLPKITSPTLITVGRYDEIAPSCAETIARGIANSRVEIFEQSAHISHLEEADKFNAILRAHLAEHDE